MAICEVCTQEMTTADSCLEWQARIGGRPWAVLRYGDEKVPEPFADDWDDDWDDGSDSAWTQRCGDCHVVLGGHHHPGCDMARCPRCQRQLISCGCWGGEVLVPQT